MLLRSTPWIALFVCAVSALPLRGQPSPAKPEGTVTGDVYELGAKFESEAAGIAFQGPGGCREIRRSASDQLVQYVNEEKKWSLTVRRDLLSKPVQLTSRPDAKGKISPGMIESTIEQLKVDVPGVEILRSDFVNVGELEVGMIAARSSVGMETRLTQRALVRATDRLYYNFTFITPASRQGKVEDDPETAKVVELFGKVIDTVRLIDQNRILEEQNQRLFRTRAVLLNFSEANIRKAIVPEQWWRLIRDGKDIGYSYIVEETANDLPRRGVPARQDARGNGVRVGVRSRTFPEKGVQVDTESWFYISFDRKNEVWSNVGIMIKPDGTKEDFGEFGSADKEIKRVRDAGAGFGEERPDGTVDANQPPMAPKEEYTLTATRNTRTLRGQPIERPLPPFYLPQALNHMLGRIVPLNEPKTFLFASWVSEQGEVMKRYIDVEAESYVTIDGKRVRAVPIKDRIGIEGSPTTHYMSPDGRYLGSIAAESKIVILPADKSTIEKLWKDADLRRPGEVKGE